MKKYAMNWQRKSGKTRPEVEEIEKESIKYREEMSFGPQECYSPSKAHTMSPKNRTADSRNKKVVLKVDINL